MSIDPTKKDNFIGSKRTCGNAKTSVNAMTVYDPNNPLRTTLKETNIHSTILNNMNSNIYKPTVYNPDEVLRAYESETIDLIKAIHYPIINSQQGLIWYYKNTNGRTLFGHNGGDIGSLTEMFISFSNNFFTLYTFSFSQ